MTRTSRTKVCALALLMAATAQAAEIERIWLSHQTAGPERLTVNWESPASGPALVEYGPTEALGQRIEGAEAGTLHHVEIPLGEAGAPVFYRVRTGADASGTYRCAGYPQDEVRIAVVADTGYTKALWAEAVLAQKPHLLLSAGDHVPALHQGQPVAAETTTAFGALVGRHAELFCTVPWLAALGNHDREVRPRGPKPPPEAVYDVEAAAFRSFFALPEPEWHWAWDLPAFGLRIAALDFSHLSDQGTTWQTCHTPAKMGEQFAWYSLLMAESRMPFLVTLYNERNSTVRGLEKGAWGRLLQRGSLAITGFGYFGERAAVEGFPYYNTSVNGTGADYRDPKNQVFAAEDNFLLLTLRRGAQPTLQVELRNLAGKVLDTQEFTPRVLAP